MYNRELFASQFTAPKIIDNLFSNVMEGILLPDRLSVPGVLHVTSTLLITCNTFKYNYTQIGQKGYGIRVGYLPKDTTYGIYQHSIVIDAKDPITGNNLNATMKNDFRVTGSMGVESSVHPVSEFVDVANHPNNPNYISYKTFHATQSQSNMLGTKTEAR